MTTEPEPTLEDAGAWVPVSARHLWRQLQAERPDDVALRALFVSPDLSDFWGHVSQAFGGVQVRRVGDAYSYLAGSILGPLRLYSGTSTADGSSPKARIRQRQKDADLLMKKACSLTHELVEVLRQLDQTSRYTPDELVVAHLLERAGIDLADGSTERYVAEHLRASGLLEHLRTALDQYPRGGRAFAGVPGMESQKSTWRDWLREVKAHLSRINRMYGTKLLLTEAHYVALGRTLIGEAVTRDAVHAALRG